MRRDATRAWCSAFTSPRVAAGRFFASARKPWRKRRSGAAERSMLGWRPSLDACRRHFKCVLSGGASSILDRSGIYQLMRIAAIDIGTNSVHMIVVRVRPDLSFEVVDREKVMVRLGAGGRERQGVTTRGVTGAAQ